MGTEIITAIIALVSFMGDSGAPGGGFDCMYIVFFVFPVAAFLSIIFLYIVAAVITGAALGFAGAAAGALAGVIGAATVYAGIMVARMFAGFISRRPSYIKSIRRAPPPPPELTGNKGSSLFRILNTDCDTPRGFILCAPALSGMTREPADGPPERVHWPVRLLKLKRALHSHFHKDETVIVRSSFFGEDSSEASFAGVYESVKDVPAHDVNAVIEAVIKVYSSYWSQRAGAYMKEKGINSAEPRAAIIVQLQLEPEWSGVAFSANPHTGHREELIVEAKKEGSEKSLVYIFNRLSGIWRSREQEECPALPRLERILPRLEENESGNWPVQIEWGLTGDDFYVLQARPAVGVPEIKTYTNSYVVDAPPYPLTPLSVSLLKRIPTGYERLLPADTRKAGLWNVFNSRLYVDYELLQDMASAPGRSETLKLIGNSIRMALRLTSRLHGFKKAAQGVTTSGGINNAVDGEAGRALEEGFLLQAAAVMMYTTYDNALKRLYAPGFPPPVTGVGGALSGTEEAGLGADTAKELLDLGDDTWKEAAQKAATGEDIEVEGLSGRAATALKRILAATGNHLSTPLELSAPRDSRNPALVAMQAKDTVRTCLKNSLAGKKSLPQRDPDTILNWKQPAAKVLLSRRRRMNNSRELIHTQLESIFGILAEAATRTGKKLADKDILGNPQDVFFLTLEEIAGPMSVLQAAAREIAERKNEYAAAMDETAEPLIHVLDGAVVDEKIPEPVASATPGTTVEGIGNNRGAAQGSALVQAKPEFAKPELMKGVILVTGAPAPDWIAWLPHIDGLVTETGGALCHLMLAAAEMGVPAIAGVAGATGMIETGMLIELDSAAGEVRIKGEESKDRH